MPIALAQSPLPQPGPPQLHRRIIRFAISQAAFDAIASTMPLGSVGYEAEVGPNGERLIWLAPNVVGRLRALRGSGETPLKPFTAYDPVAKWTLGHVAADATASAAKTFARSPPLPSRSKASRSTALGVLATGAAIAYAGQPPAPGLCWYYTDPSYRIGFWDACQ